ncbi:MAG TPA: ATP-binding protein [Thermoanaerobaculia bacterium]
MRGSLRTRLFAGAVVWMTAVLIAVIALVVRLTRNHPELATRHGTHIVMGIVTLAFLGGGLYLVRKALAPFRTLRAGLSSVRAGSSQRIDGEYPSEVQPLVNDLNALLDDRERAVTRALTTAGDLAHGLKTPLAVLAQEAERTGDAMLGEQVERMQQQVDYHLARARATASSAPGLRCAVLPSVEGLVRTMRRLHAERALTIEVDIAPEHAIRGRREDLDEMLGNLLDNACKWARSRVVIASSVDETHVFIAVDDDGPGLDPSMRAQVLQRGMRADQQVRGSGLGLAIVNDLAELYGGSVALETSLLGGTRARLQLPAARQ